MNALRSLLVIALVLLSVGLMRAEGTYTLTVTVKEKNEQKDEIKYVVPGFLASARVTVPLYYAGRNGVLSFDFNTDTKGTITEIWVGLLDGGLMIQNVGPVQIFSAKYPFKTGEAITLLDGENLLTVQIEEK